MRGSIREVKREIRLLGVEATVVRRGYIDFVGTVFRGGLWLDGALRRRVRDTGKDATRKLSIAIRRSPHFGQLRVIILGESPEMRRTLLDAERLHELTGLPVILLSEDARQFRAFGLDEPTARRVLGKARGPEPLPEALKVARLFARGLKTYSHEAKS